MTRPSRGAFVWDQSAAGMRPGQGRGSWCDCFAPFWGVPPVVVCVILLPNDKPTFVNIRRTRLVLLSAYIFPRNISAMIAENMTSLYHDFQVGPFGTKQPAPSPSDDAPTTAAPSRPATALVFAFSDPRGTAFCATRADWSCSPTYFLRMARCWRSNLYLSVPLMCLPAVLSGFGSGRHCGIGGVFPGRDRGRRFDRHKPHRAREHLWRFGIYHRWWYGESTWPKPPA